ncbi:MAG TPA: glycosyltransferase, partial [Burkholderiaceae bacterium]|nr:glycosyltransferase [Burkholderiaceae bacterium]
MPEPLAASGAIEPAPVAPAWAAQLAISNHGLRHSGGIERYAMTLVRALHARGIRPALIAKVFDTRLPEYGWVRPVHAGVGLVPGKWRDFAFDWRIGRAKRRLRLFPLIGCNQTRWSDIAICGSTHPGFLA